MTKIRESAGASQKEVQAGSRGEWGSQCRADERSETARNGEAHSLRLCEKSKNENLKTPNPEVLEKPRRRKFSAKYKKKILDEADACTEPGQIGALLRREGLYSSHLFQWRGLREKALKNGLEGKKRGRKIIKDPRQKQFAHLERENAHLKARLQEAKLIIDIQKKTSELLGIKLADVSENERRMRGEENA